VNIKKKIVGVKKSIYRWIQIWKCKSIIY